MSDFEDENGQKLPASVVKYSPITTQIASLEQAEKINESGSAAGSGSKASVGSNVVVNVLLSGSLSQVWAMIEGLQVVCHMGLFKMKSPGNVNAFNEFFAELASFNVIDTDTVTNDFFYFPEMDAISLNFQNAGFDTNLLVPSLGTLFYIIVGQISLVFVHMLLYLLAKAIPKTSVLKNKVSTYLYWNGSIRFMMESYMDILLFSLMNLE